jgi:signal transduction histidine kinase
MRVFDLSLRHKIPLWGSVLIVATTVAISAALMVRAYEDLLRDLLTSSESLGHTLAKTVFPALLHDDLWRAFEIIKAPLRDQASRKPLDAESIFVLSPELKILVATDPRRMPTLADLDGIGPEYGELARSLRAGALEKSRAFDIDGARHFHVATPITEGGRQMGILVISHDKDAFHARFLDLAMRGAVIGLLVVAVILPINWYWGRRTAEPLVALAQGMGALVQGEPVKLDPQMYNYRDEVGQLFEAYGNAARVLQEKALLEQEVLQSERLAAVGRLAAGIAHEVNNPLGGMLMALDNLRQRGPLDASVAKTADLLQRGLQQIAETVGALLVESRTTSRPLGLHDFADVRTLIEPQATRRQVALDWTVSIPGTVALPAGFVRQILINLLLNAVQATAGGGRVRLVATAGANELVLMVANSGEPLPDTLREHLFEPFASGREGGHGLGLWVTYQTVVQMGGSIAADWEAGEVRFTVTLPLGREPAR